MITVLDIVGWNNLHVENDSEAIFASPCSTLPFLYYSLSPSYSPLSLPTPFTYIAPSPPKIWLTVIQYSSFLSVTNPFRRSTYLHGEKRFFLVFPFFFCLFFASYFFPEIIFEQNYIQNILTLQLSSRCNLFVLFFVLFCFCFFLFFFYAVNFKITFWII